MPGPQKQSGDLFVSAVLRVTVDTGDCPMTASKSLYQTLQSVLVIRLPLALPERHDVPNDLVRVRLASHECGAPTRRTGTGRRGPTY